MKKRSDSSAKSEGNIAGEKERERKRTKTRAGGRGGQNQIKRNKNLKFDDKK